MPENNPLQHRMEQGASEQQAQQALDALLEMARISGQGAVPAPASQGASSAQSVPQQMARLTRDVLGCDRLGLVLVEPQTEIVRPLAVVGLSKEQERQWWEEQLREERRLDEGTSPDLIKQLRAGEILILDLRQPPWNSAPNPYNIKTMLAAPLLVGTRLLGVLTLDYGGQEHQYTAQELALTQAVTQLLALVIEHEHLQRSNVQLSELIGLAHDAILIRTPDNRITFWNRGAERLYGWSEQEALGQITHRLLQTQFPDSEQAINERLVEEGLWEGELQHQHRDGRPVTVESRQVVVRDEQQRISAILEINRDISERMRLLAEQASIRASEEAARQTEDLIDEFIGTVGHELRTPLTTLKASIQLVRKRLTRTNEAQQVSLEEVQQAILFALTLLDRAERQVAVQNRLVGDLLDMSRIRVHRLELVLAECNLKSVVKEVVEDQVFLDVKRTITLELPSEEQLLVIGDEDRLRQVVHNYLTNALKYSADTTPVLVRLERKDGQALVSVTDQGPGLTEAEREQVWMRFYRAGKVTGNKGSTVGLGLGLYICRTLIERQGGQVGVESQPGAGSTFWFSLPLI
jgi:PAS domain S-box-containing protein